MRLKMLLLLSFVAVLPAVIPLFRSGFISGHDFTHAARIAELDRGLKVGQIPARWSDNFGWGYGMPLLHFYAPLFYYVSEVFVISGFSIITAIKLSVIISVLLGFTGAYKLGYELHGKWGTLITAVAFSYAPYRAVQLYVRGAFSEMLATSVIPFIILFSYILIKRDKHHAGPLIGLALSLTALLLSHNVITVIALPFICLWIILLFIYFGTGLAGILKRSALVLVSLAMAAGLSAWFVVPAFFEKNATQVGAIFGGYSYYKLHFVHLFQLVKPYWGYGGSLLGPDDGLSFQLGLAHMGVLLTVTIMMFLSGMRRRSSERNRQLIMFGGILTIFMISLFLTSYRSEQIWKHVSILQTAQFPWRFLGIAIVFASLAIGSLGPLTKQLGNKTNSLVVAVICTVLVLSTLGYFRPEKYVDDQFFRTDEGYIQNNLSDTLNDYIPLSGKKDLPPGLPQVTLNRQEYQPLDYKRSNGFRSFHIDSSGGGVVRIATYNFLGWTLKIDNKVREIITEPEYGFISFQLPPGPHLVELRLEKTELQIWSERVSVIFWMGLLIFIIVTVRKKVPVPAIKGN